MSKERVEILLMEMKLAAERKVSRAPDMIKPWQQTQTAWWFSFRVKERPENVVANYHALEVVSEHDMETDSAKWKERRKAYAKWAREIEQERNQVEN